MSGYWTIVRTYRNGFNVFCPKCQSGNIFDNDSSSNSTLRLMYPGSRCEDCGYKDLSDKFPTRRELRINQILS